MSFYRMLPNAYIKQGDMTAISLSLIKVGLFPRLFFWWCSKKITFRLFSLRSLDILRHETFVSHSIFTWIVSWYFMCGYSYSEPNKHFYSQRICLSILFRSSLLKARKSMECQDFPVTGGLESAQLAPNPPGWTMWHFLTCSTCNVISKISNFRSLCFMNRPILL
jgi:uncharacterized membrane protein (DUF106 family)